MKNKMKKILSLLLAVMMLTALCGCGATGYRVSAVETLLEQEYSIAFRNDDPIGDIVMAGIQVLAAEGKVAELSLYWFGDKDYISFPSNAKALDDMEIPEGKTLLVGVDVDSFPMAYLSNGRPWGYDIQLAEALAERLGWTISFQTISKEDVYVELYSGNIDCAWGGIALEEAKVAAKSYVQFGPYVKNDIVVASRDGSRINNRLQLNGKNMAMPITTEATAALNADGRLMNRLGQVTRLAGGTIECFEYLFTGKCDAIMTDTTAIAYYNCH